MQPKSKFVGKLDKDNNREGYGEMYYVNNDEFKGYWRKNMKNGYGQMKFNNGTIYMG